MSRTLGGAFGVRRRRLLLGVCALLAGACAKHVELPPTSPFYGSTLPPYDGLVRHTMLAPTEDGIDAVRDASPKDDVVRLLNEGLLLHRAGRYRESNQALQRAAAIATDRYTRSLAQEVASLIVSDNVLDYQASALERSMVHYYGMLNYLALGDSESALVEARRANALLRRYGNDFPGRTFVNDAAVQYVAGMLQWGRREENDAIVSLRQALAGYEEYELRYGVRTPVPVAVDAARVAAAVGLPDVAERTTAAFLVGREADAAAPARDPESGDVLLVIENGFIAHKRQQKLFVPILRSERDAVLAGDAASAVEAAFRVLIRTVVVMNEMGREGQSAVQAHEDGVVLVSAGLSAVGVELVTMAWPVYELEAHRATAIRVETADGSVVEPALVEDLSAIAVRDFEEQKTSMLLRMIGRTLLREAAIVQAERAGERAGGALGSFTARVTARALANTAERADTRSWTALPAELLVARLRLPPGAHELRVTFQGVRGPESRSVTVEVEPGAVALRSVSLYGRDRGDRARFSGATREVVHRVPPRRARS